MRLVTTPISPWVGETNDVVYLGQWCRDQLGDSSAPLLIHTTPRATLSEKVQLTLLSNRIFEELFSDLVFKANLLHGEIHDQRYWRIICGRWLMGFVDVVIQRWSLIDSALATYPITHSDGLLLDGSLRAPVLSQDYLLQLTSHEWNSALFGSILTFRGIEMEMQKVENITRYTQLIRPPHTSSSLRLLYSFLARHSRVAISESYFSRREEFLLGARLRSLPLLPNPCDMPAVTYDVSAREELRLDDKVSTHPVTSFIRRVLHEWLPFSVVELHASLRRSAQSGSYPHSPRGIVTANKHHSDDRFMTWMADQAEKGTPLILAQHGGLYGESEIRTRHEEHEIQIADRYLTWGWHDSRYENIRAVPVQLPRRKARAASRAGENLVIVLDATLRYSRHCWDTQVESADYLLRIRDLVHRLEMPIRSKTIVRLHHAHTQLNADNRLIIGTIAPAQFDDGFTPMFQVLRDARIVVSTTLGTTFGEAIQMRIPSLILLDELVYPIRAESVNVFNQLKKNKIYSTDINDLVETIGSLWDDPCRYWSDEARRTALKSYLQRHACHETQRVKRWLRECKPTLNWK